MTDEDELRLALKKAHEIKSKIDDFILHLNEVYKKHFLNNPGTAFRTRDALETHEDIPTLIRGDEDV